MAKQVRKVIHLEVDGEHYYFGSLKALCEQFGDELHISYDYLRRVKITPKTPYTNRKKEYIIREGVLITTPKDMDKSQQMDDGIIL